MIKNKIKEIVLLGFLLIVNSCSYPEMSKEELIYSNDFESSNLDNIDGGKISSYNQNNLLGYYNKDGFNLHLNEIGDHDYIFVSFDLYIHGSWDGNFNGFEKNDKPDTWMIEVRPGMNPFQDSDTPNFTTTFSNTPCFSNWCRRQSFPEEYPYENNPMSGASQTALSPSCNIIGSAWEPSTTLYKIEKSFRHTGNSLAIRFYDELYQPNAIDSDGKSIELCDESWSLDNLRIRIVSFK